MEGFEKIKYKWEALQQRCEIDIPFNTYEWYHSWWSNFRPSNSFNLIVVYKNESKDEICAILPTYTTYIKNTTKPKLSTWSNTHSFRTGILCDRDYYEAIDYIFAYINNKLSWEYFTIPYLVSNHETKTALKKALSRQKLNYLSSPGMTSPLLDLECTWDDYFGKLNRKTRESLRRKTRKLLEKSNGTIEIHHGLSDKLESKLKDCWTISKNTWKQKIGSSIAADDKRVKFYEEIAKNESNWIVLALLYIEGTPIAFEYNILYNSTLYNLKLGYNEGYRKLSPGIVLRLKMLEWAFSNNNVQTFDFMGNAAEYKLMFSTRQLEHDNINIYSSSLKHTLLVLYKGKLRPILARNLRPLRDAIKRISISNVTK
jgi:hypothetical protein